MSKHTVAIFFSLRTFLDFKKVNLTIITKYKISGDNERCLKYKKLGKLLFVNFFVKLAIKKEFFFISSVF